MTIKTEWVAKFRRCGHASKDQHLFQVVTGVDLADALREVYGLLDMVQGPIFEAGMENEPLKGNPAWLVLHALESAQAVVESLVESSVLVKWAAEEAEKAAKQEVSHV